MSGGGGDLYCAYGSNLWHAQMALRCPGATLAGPYVRVVVGTGRRQ